MSTGKSLPNLRRRCVCLVFLIWILPAATAQSSTQLRGQVLDADTHIPISGAQVSTLGGQSQAPDLTDKRGRFDLQLAKGVGPGSVVRIRVTRSGYGIADQKK
jgi:hypothetical protein